MVISQPYSARDPTTGNCITEPLNLMKPLMEYDLSVASWFKIVCDSSAGTCLGAFKEGESKTGFEYH
jgi:hypothetical protein